MPFVLSLTQRLICLSVNAMLGIILSICVCAAVLLFCTCLVSVHVSAPHVMWLRCVGGRTLKLLRNFVSYFVVGTIGHISYVTCYGYTINHYGFHVLMSASRQVKVCGHTSVQTQN